MTYSYESPLTYGAQQPVVYDGMKEKKTSSIPYGVGGLVIGAVGGGLIGNKINPFVSKNGEATDSFTKSVLSKKMSSAPEAEKKVYNQTQEILKSIKNVTTVEELKILFNNNKDAVDKVFSDSAEFLKNVTDENIESNKKTIKQKFTTEEDTAIQTVKNEIQSCWNKDSKEFKKVDSVKQEVFDAIKDSTKGVKTKLIAKYAAIGGAVAGVGAFVAHKLLANKEEIK